MKPKVLVFRTAGTNCDKETVHAFKVAGADVDLRHINLIKKGADFSSYQVIAFPGGFSYGDDLGAGKIFSLELLLWCRDALAKMLDKGGLILGICNGFQVLVRLGILPDLDFEQKTTLITNDSHRFEDRWVHLKLENNESAAKKIWLKGLPEIIDLPIAHMEGKFFSDKTILDKIEKSNQVALRYVTASGESADYPACPNGSLNNIAGITDISGRVLGLMPHPERFAFSHQYPVKGDQEPKPWGLEFFKNAVNYFK